MRDEVRRDLDQSSADFVRAVWPVVQARCADLRGSVLRLVESHASMTVTQELDVCAGIDAYQRTLVNKVKS